MTSPLLISSVQVVGVPFPQVLSNHFEGKSAGYKSPFMTRHNDEPSESIQLRLSDFRSKLGVSLDELEAMRREVLELMFEKEDECFRICESILDLSGQIRDIDK